MRLDDTDHLLVDLYDHLNSLHGAENQRSVLHHLEGTKQCMKVLEPHWISYNQNLGVTARLWSMYIDMVLIMKRYIHSERSGNWERHLLEVKNMTPYIISAGHSKYASCIPIYLKDMANLEQKHPATYEQFVKGNFTVRQKQGGFNGVWTDLALEKTYNKEGKTTLLKGVTLNSATREKYIKAAPVMTKVSQAVKDMANITSDIGCGHHGNSAKQVKEDARLVDQLNHLLNEAFINPFKSANKNDLFNICTGAKALHTDLIEAREKGVAAMNQAIEERSDKVILPKIQCFADKKKSKTTNNTTQIYQDEATITRVLCFLQRADDKTRNDAFSHEWTRYPSSIFKPDPQSETGYAMVKGTKSEFLAGVIAQTKDFFLLDSLPPTGDFVCTYLIDAMAFVQRFQHLGATYFDDRVRRYINKILQIAPAECKIVHIVGDRYDKDDSVSLKRDERLARLNTGEMGPQFIPEGNLRIPDWKLFIKNPVNKANLLDFISDTLC